ncbi:MAG: family 20 glycosylhydrolase [Bacteroidales bacterium]|nr:family 20 glycosylhydrolase [Bacteroidales bacterium]
MINRFFERAAMAVFIRMRGISVGLLLLLMVLLAACSNEQSEVKIVPVPASLTINKGTCRISRMIPLYLSSDDADLKMAADYLLEKITTASGLELNEEVIGKQPAKGIYLAVGKVDFSDNPDAYSLNVTAKSIQLTGNSARAVFYGVQTILQLLPPAIFGNDIAMEPGDLVMPCVEIKDEPRYKWRGMHLDVGRHVFPVEFIKKYIDLIAMHKMNVFHWHLTEDQGWRIEIKKYPLLTEIGSVRKTDDGGTYGGYYTQEQVKEVVEYARTRFVDVMPEIEMPGHSVAALAAYPQLSCTGGPFEVRNKWGVSKDVYCAGKEETFDFIEDVLSEVVELFPFKYIHIGGDECPKDRWKECDDCQRRIRQEGLKDEHELQSWFIQRIEKFLQTKNRRLVGWDEILEGGLAPEATVMSWRGISGGIKAAHELHDVIMSPTSHCYFDFYQGDPRYEPKAIGGFLPLEKVYSYEPTPEELNQEEAKHILGAQGNVWTEYIPTTEQAEYMALPRMSALAEVVWSPAELRDYEGFVYRMEAQYARLDAMDVNYRIPVPVVSNNSFVFIKEFTLELHKAVEGGEILFTTDGSDPSVNGKEYTGPITFTQDASVKAVTKMPSGHTSSTIDIALDKQDIVTGIELERVEGLNYSFYKGSFKSVNDFTDLKPTGRGMIREPGLPEEIEEYAYGLVINGYVLIEKAGIYRFFTFSDDGSVLLVRGQAVVQNDGPHAPKESSGEIALGQGWHPVELRYFQAGGGKVLEMKYSGPDLEKQDIPAAKLAAQLSPMKLMR